MAKENIDIRNKKINEDIKDLLLVMENLQMIQEKKDMD